LKIGRFLLFWPTKEFFLLYGGPVHLPKLKEG